MAKKNVSWKKEFISEFLKGRNCAIYQSDGKRITIALRPAIENCRNPRFYEMAVTYCSPNDKPKKLTGKVEAISQLEDGKFITIPAKWIENRLFEFMDIIENAYS